VDLQFFLFSFAISEIIPNFAVIRINGYATLIKKITKLQTTKKKEPYKIET